VSEITPVRTTPPRLDFVQRLSSATQAIGCKATPTEIARRFNLRFPHDAVSAQAVRRWLKGQSFPTDEKMVALGEWLSVDPAWLRFGDAPGHKTPSFHFDDSLERDIALLNADERAVIRKVTDLMLAVRAGRQQ
jgi:hypothetical protein